MRKNEELKTNSRKWLWEINEMRQRIQCLEGEATRLDCQKANLRQELDVAMDNMSQLADRNRQLGEERDAIVQKLAAQEIVWAQDQALLRQLRRDHAEASG